MTNKWKADFSDLTLSWKKTNQATLQVRKQDLTNPYCCLWFNRRSWLMLAQCHIWCLSQLNVFTQDQNFAQECTTQGKEQEQENKPKHDPFTNTSWLLASSPPFLHLKPSQLGHQYRQRADTFACHVHPDSCSGCFQESFTYTMMQWCIDACSGCLLRTFVNINTTNIIP